VRCGGRGNKKSEKMAMKLICLIPLKYLYYFYNLIIFRVSYFFRYSNHGSVHQIKSWKEKKRKLFSDYLMIFSIYVVPIRKRCHRTASRDQFCKYSAATRLLDLEWREECCAATRTHHVLSASKLLQNLLRCYADY